MDIHRRVLTLQQGEYELPASTGGCFCLDWGCQTECQPSEPPAVVPFHAALEGIPVFRSTWDAFMDKQHQLQHEPALLISLPKNPRAGHQAMYQQSGCLQKLLLKRS